MPPQESVIDPAVSSELQAKALVDRFGRVHDSLRISVTDHCNLRCFYCMPETVERFQDASQLLTFPQIERVVRLLTQFGVRKIRITGGEPTLRKDLPDLIGRLRQIAGITDLAMTTNAVRLAELAVPLRDAGLNRLNISLDALNEETFQRITRRQGLQRILDGIDAGIAAGFDSIRLNTLAIRNCNESEIIPLVEFALQRRLTLRFIEYMPLDADRGWQAGQVLSGSELRSRIESHFGTLVPKKRDDRSQPSQDFDLSTQEGTIGFINPVSAPFCGNCNRLRLTAEGALRNCLFSDQEWPLRAKLQGGAADVELAREIQACVQAKWAGHTIAQPGFEQPQRAMYQIGG